MKLFSCGTEGVPNPQYSQRTYDEYSRSQNNNIIYDYIAFIELKFTRKNLRWRVTRRTLTPLTLRHIIYKYKSIENYSLRSWKWKSWDIQWKICINTHHKIKSYFAVTSRWKVLVFLSHFNIRNENVHNCLEIRESVSDCLIIDYLIFIDR